ERAAKWVRRRPAIAGLLIALTTIFLAGLFGVTWQWRRAATAAVSEQRERVKAENLTQQKNRLLFRAYLANGLQHMDDGKLQTGLAWFTEALQTAGADAQEEAIHRLRLSMAI